MIYTVLITVFL